MSNIPTLRITELDFNTIKNNLKTFLRSQSEFTDFDFEGSGMDVLLNILAVNTHYNAFYHNMVANEMFLDTAQLRASVLSWAKALNYLPSSKKSATTLVNIKVTPTISEDNLAQTLTLSQYTNLLSEPLDGQSYNFMVMAANTTTKTANGTFEFNNVQIKQGELQSFLFTADTSNPKRRFTLPSANTDTDTITVTVQESLSNTTTTAYMPADDITTIQANSSVYFIEENSDANGSYTIYFGDGVIGKNLSNGNLVLVKYVDTQSTFANKANGFSVIQPINGYSGNVSVTSLGLASGGSQKETVNEIRKRAPIQYGVQNRAVTTNDYQALILKDYPYVDSVSVWSGQDNNPPVYGKVFISLKPKDNFQISLLDKTTIKNEILSKRSVLTIIPEIVDPDYTYILFNSTVYYSSSLVTLSEDQLKSIVNAAIQDYTTNNLNTFNSTLRFSAVISNILGADSSITGNALKITLQKRIVPTLNFNSNYTMYFNTAIKKGSIGEKVYSYPEVSVLDSNGISRNVVFEETPFSDTGIASVSVVNPGSGYTSLPTITILGDGTGAQASAVIVNGKLTSINVTTPGTNYNQATVTITGGNGSGATAVVNLSQNAGTLRTYYYKPTGEKVIVDSSAGTIDYSNGIINIDNFNPTGIIPNSRYSNDTVTFNITPQNQIISPTRNLILAFDANDGSSVQIQMISE